MITLGEKLIQHLEARGVEVIFGIPGVHTLAHYRGLAGSKIRHITPRHEQGAGFMADGYARVSGKVGVSLVITGAGLTNILTAMAQARGDSIPMLVISAENPLSSKGKGRGCLHELPDQSATLRSIALDSFTVQTEAELADAMDSAFQTFATKRAGPVHIAIPYDAADVQVSDSPPTVQQHQALTATDAQIAEATSLLHAAKNPLIIAGGGLLGQDSGLAQLAEKLDAPVITTANGRGMLHGHTLAVHASPSLAAVRGMIEEAEWVLMLGSEIGATDYDMYATGTLPHFQRLIRVDICPEQLARHQAALTICADAADTATCLAHALPAHSGTTGAGRAKSARENAFAEVESTMRFLSRRLGTIRNCLPKAIFVGDSTQAIYAGNLCYDHDRAKGWFNSSTGFGTLGYGIPAAIGAAIGAEVGTRVVCLTGDGGAQFSLPELMVARQHNLPITFVVWNNQGYKEIENSMIAADIAPVGCDALPPDFRHIAQAYGMGYKQAELAMEMSILDALRDSAKINSPTILEVIF